MELSSLIGDLLTRRRSFRGEFDFTTEDGDVRPLAIRGDPVLVSPGRVLGFVVLVSDLSVRRAAENARRSFQDDLTAARQHDAWRRGGHPAFRKLLSSVLGNAQLAALEITEGVDPKRMPGMLESIRASVDRTTELLERLSARTARRRRGPR